MRIREYLQMVQMVEAAWATEAEKALRPPLNAGKKKRKKKLGKKLKKRRNPSPREEM